MKKYKLLDSDTKVLFGKTLFRIQALISFGDVQEGDLGGYIEKEENLSHDGNAWVYNNAQVLMKHGFAVAPRFLAMLTFVIMLMLVVTHGFLVIRTFCI